MNEIEMGSLSDLQNLLNEQTIIKVEVSNKDSSVSLYFKDFKLVIDAFNIGHLAHLNVRAFKELL